jgi:hypothetical protein
MLAHPADHRGLALAGRSFQVLQATLINRIGNGVVGDVQVRLFGKLVRADLARLRGAAFGLLRGVGALRRRPDPRGGDQRRGQLHPRVPDRGRRWW